MIDTSIRASFELSLLLALLVALFEGKYINISKIQMCSFHLKWLLNQIIKYLSLVIFIIFIMLNFSSSFIQTKIKLKKNDEQTPKHMLHLSTGNKKHRTKNYSIINILCRFNRHNINNQLH